MVELCLVVLFLGFIFIELDLFLAAQFLLSFILFLEADLLGFLHFCALVLSLVFGYVSTFRLVVIIIFCHVLAGVCLLLGNLGQAISVQTNLLVFIHICAGKFHRN